MPQGPATGGDLLVASLIANGLKTIFTLPGLQLDPVFDALAKRRDEVRIFHTRHEQGAAYMADGYARVTGRPSCCMVVPGPGLLNAMAGLATAYACSSPVLCVTGQTPSSTIDAGLGLLHEIKDQLGMVRAVVKWSGRAMSPDDVPQLVVDALTEMLSGRPLPAEIEIPPDVLAATALRPADIGVATIAPVRPAAATVDAALAALQSAERPLIMAGGGAVRSGATAEITALAERLGAPVVMTTNGKGSLSARHSLAFEATAIPHLLPQADMIVAIGTRFAPRNGTRWSLRDDQTLIKVDADATELTRAIAPEVSIHGDAKIVLDLLLDLLPAASRATTWRGLGELREQLRAATDAIQPQAAFGRVIRETLSDDTIVIDGMNQVGYWSRFGFPVYEPRTFISPGYQGTLGFELPTGLGAQVGAAPGQRVVVVTGDGGLLFNVGEFATAVQHNINVVTVVFNDNAYGNVLRTQDDEYGGRRIASDLRNPDFMRLADSFGVVGMRAGGPEELGRCLLRALEDDRPSLIEVPVGGMQDPWPLIQGH